MRRHVVAVLAVVLVLGLAIAVGVLWNRPPDDLPGEWIATSVEVDDTSLLESTDSSLPILTITDVGRLDVSITAGCNTSVTEMTYRIGGAVELGEFLSTAIGCPERLATLESGLTDALGGVDHVEVDGDELVLTGDGARMAFTRLTE